MRKIIFLFTITVILSGVVYYSAFAALNQVTEIPQSSEKRLKNAPAPTSAKPKSDSTTVRFPVAKTAIEQPSDLFSTNPIDLKTPQNVQSVIEYDEATNSYLFRTRVGEDEVATPFMLNTNEYNDYSLRRSLIDYYRTKNAETFSKGVEEFDFLDMKFNIKALDKIFGPGGVKLKTQGSAELIFGVKTNNVQNPILPVRQQRKTYFDFDEKIQINVNASVGEKMNFAMNYNTDATFDFDSKKIKLQYSGTEDEIIKNIEAGNVSMNTNSSLIRGGAALFGVKATMQFGKLTATALVSQQESETQTLNMQGGAQLTPFELSVDKYDENRHFFLSHYFRETYDRNMSKLPYIASGITINRIEVWVTNKRSDYNSSRNVVAFMDLGESKRISNNLWIGNPALPNPSNNSNNLYSQLNTAYKDSRNINLVNQTLSFLDGGKDYVKVESARKLDPSEYTLNTQLGYISLRSMLYPDEVLGVAFEYTMGGKVYQVGEFAADIENTNESLYLKMLKSTTISTEIPMWHLMMKNIYSLNAYQVQKEKFKLNILYLSDTTGLSINYLPVGNIKSKLLLRVMNLDRLDRNNEPNPDGVFDFVEGYTILPQQGKIIFPVIEPFGSNLKTAIGNDALAAPYVFQELYDSTRVVAQQLAEKNKFLLKGEYKSSSGNEIRLGAMNVPRGSVRVTAGGMQLTENVDYSVDYSMGVVTILNQAVAESGTPISVSMENQSMFSMQRKTMLGVDLNYDFSKDFKVGATIMHLSEKSITQKVNIGNEVINNTLWGLNTNYTTQFQWLTNWVDKLPFISATVPSRFTIQAEVAQLIPTGSKNSQTESGASYIDDFEAAQLGLDLRNPYSWNLASTPSMFPESADRISVAYGYNRALTSWYYIDRLFTQKNSSLTPTHLKNDLDQLSNHYIREINSYEIFPNKELGYGQSSTLQVLNLSYYPTLRGPYNLDADGTDSEGYLINPKQRWGGIMRKMDNTDFESSNIEYIQFWMLDPFLNDKEGKMKGGELYFNFGELSEDILKDGMKSFENGLPINSDQTQITTTQWGRVSKRQSMVYAFDNTAGARSKQDVGLDGLANTEEYNFNSYQNYLTKLNTKLSPAAKARMQNDAFSALNDPAGDNYHFYRGVDYDNLEMNILSRYQHYNGVEGNSMSVEEAADKLYQSSRTTPDVEDINQDNTLNEYERYFEYKVNVNREELKVGQNFITDVRTTNVLLRNGRTEEVKWYQFKVPLREFNKRYGGIQDFKTIRFARIFLTNFEEEVHLRFASMELVRGEWRTYMQPLNQKPVISTGAIDVSVVNIEENAGQTPVNYVLPPGVTRIIDPGQTQITQLNEQALSLKVTNLSPGDARGVYKNSNLDMRNYRRLQMYVHAEKLIGDITHLQNGDMSVFIRIGSDNRSNYYEYEVPLVLTPEGRYNNNNGQDQEKVWPHQNRIDFDLSILTDLKLQRNSQRRNGDNSINFSQIFGAPDPHNERNRIYVIGNPTLSDVRVMLIGVRNNSQGIKEGVVWTNELRLTEFNEDGGWAARANANLAISDLATLNVGGQIETTGFGGLDQSLNQRRLDNFYQYNIATNVELGKFFPEKAKIKAPLFYSINDQRTNPKYNPLDQDILLTDALNNAQTKAEKDSITDFSQKRTVVESFSIPSLMVDIRSKVPMPYDPANFSIGYSYSKLSKKDPSILFDNAFDYRGNFSYTYSPFLPPLKPFAFIKSKSKSWALFKEMEINYLPNNIAFNTNISRNYFEQQYRDFDSGSNLQLPTTYSKNFLWDRQFSIQWNLTKALNFSLQTGTNARIEEPMGVVNKSLFPDEYRNWKDSVIQSVLDLGRPWGYNQTFSASYTVPLNKIPMLNFASLSLRYNGTYNWERGVMIDPTTEMGNNINNNGQLNIEGRLNFETLYNKSKYLKKVNDHFNNNNNNRSKTTPKSKEKKTYSQKVTLRKDSSILIKHNLDNKRLVVTAKNSEGKAVVVNYKVKDKNTIEVLNNDSLPWLFSIVQGTRPEETIWYQSSRYLSRTAMLIRNVSIRYRQSNTMFVPAFRPEIGDVFGQSHRGGVFSPGLDFALGMTGDNYIEKAIERDWLLRNDSLVTPATTSQMREFGLDATLEPIRGLKITLNATHASNDNSQIQFMYDGMPTQRGGTFSMTHIALASAMESANASNGYNSKAFNQFLENREIIANRLKRNYVGKTYPSTGFMEDNPLAGELYNPINGGIRTNSPDVLIPAFLAAYTGKNPNKIEPTAFPSLLSLLPNWRITYDGLVRIPGVDNFFKSIQLSHAYRCTYSVGSFNSYLNWVEATGGLGFVKDELSGAPLPSSPYDIQSVSITESFAPLLGIDLTFKSNITARAEYKNSRNLTLNAGAGQIVEATQQELTVGAGYKIANFNAILKIKQKSKAYNNDLTIRGDFSFKKQQALIRRIEQGFTQATNGTKSIMFKLSADYAFSKLITLRAFYDLQINTPLVSSSAYPVSNSNFGLSIRLSLARK